MVAQVVEQVYGGFVVEEVIQVVEAEVQNSQKDLLGFGNTVDRLNMVEEVYFLDYTLSILVAKVEFAQEDQAKFAMALESSTMVDKYYMVYIVGAWILVGPEAFVAKAFAAWVVKVEQLGHFPI